MTRICLSYFNHGVGARSLADMRHFLTDGLTALGHDVDVSERIETDRLMIVTDYFAGGMGQRLLDSGAEFAVIATEIPTRHPDSGAFQFNNRTDQDWPLRAVTFSHVAPKAKAILVMDPRPETLEAYRQFGVPVSYLGVGYSETLEREMLRWDAEPDLDFAFTGVSTPYRLEVLHALSKRYATGYQPGLLSFEARNIMLRRARCNLCLKLTEDWPLPSFTRIMATLHAGRPAIADQTRDDLAPSHLVRQMDIRNITWPAEVADPMQALEILKDEYPAAKVVGSALEVL